MSYALRPVATGDDDLAMLARFLARVFDRPELYVPDYLRWLYRDNPAGEVIGVNAWEGERLAAHYAVVPFEAASGSGRGRAALSLNTATDPADQGRGLFVRLAEETYRRAAESGVREILGVANANSTPGFVRRLGFRDCGRLDARILWRPPGLRADAAEPGWSRIWSPESLRWRASNPRARYALQLRRGLRAWLAPTGWPGIRAVLRLEPLAGATELPGLPRAGRPPLWLWIGRSARVSLPRAGHAAIPLRLRPSPLTLIHRALGAGGTAPEPEAMQLEVCDFDAY
jgi:GNAT superfamily N-acetyltransferase